jgi:hypothetical protein
MSGRWRQLLEEAEAMPKLHPAQLYDVARLLVEVASDWEFLQFLRAARLNGLDVLNHVLRNTGVDFGDLQVLVRAFPDKRQWEGVDLRELKLRCGILPRVNV